MLKSRLPRIAAGLEPIVRESLKESAEMLAERARELVPVETGELRDAIHTDSEPEGVYVIAGDTRAFYGHIVEHGSVHAAPRPFMMPALQDKGSEIIANTAKAIRMATEIP